MTTHHFDDKKANLKVLISAIGAKEANCRVRLTIHTVTNLPVLDGAFRVRWKFRDIDSKAGRAHKKEHEERQGHNDVSDRSMTTSSASTDSSALLATALLADSGHSTPSSSAQKPINFSLDERGTTPYKNMRRDHTVTFDHTVEVVASMRIVKGELIAEPLKLVIERRTEESETTGLNRKFEPRIGHKYIDLAEFVNEGKVRRKYLLERSKTNAMVTISLDIATTKAGLEFRKPALRQDHLLIGRKEPVRPPTKDLAPITTSNGLKSTLKRNPSTTSTSTSSSAGYKKSIIPLKTETEAVIEALFNPSVFNKSSTPVITESPPAINSSNKFEEALTPRPRDGGRGGNASDSDDSDDVPHSYHSDKRSSLGSRSRPHSPTDYRRGSLASQQRTALDLALDINQRKVRPKPAHEGSWTFVEFEQGAPRLKRAPPRTDTGDSEFSTTSSDPHPAAQDSPRPLSPAQSFGRPGMPSIKIQSGTPIIAQESGKGRFLKGIPLRKGSANEANTPTETNEPGTPLGRRSTAPAHVRSGPRRSSGAAASGGIAAALASAGKMSMDVGGRLGSLDLGTQAAQDVFGPAAKKGRASLDGPPTSGQLTPTPETVGEKTFAGLVQT